MCISRNPINIKAEIIGFFIQQRIHFILILINVSLEVEQRMYVQWTEYINIEIISSLYGGTKRYN